MGFYDVSFKGKAFEFQRLYGSYVMENVLFKISFPAEFHSQTAVTCSFFSRFYSPHHCWPRTVAGPGRPRCGTVYFVFSRS